MNKKYVKNRGKSLNERESLFDISLIMTYDDDHEEGTVERRQRRMIMKMMIQIWNTGWESSSWWDFRAERMILEAKIRHEILLHIKREHK